MQVAKITNNSYNKSVAITSYTPCDRDEIMDLYIRALAQWSCNLCSHTKYVVFPFFFLQYRTDMVVSKVYQENE